MIILMSISVIWAAIAWFRGFKWWVLLPLGTLFLLGNYNSVAWIAHSALLIMAVCGTNIEEKKDKKIKVNCPQCGRLLKGATREMIGDTGVCPKCKTEFVIEQKQ